MEWLGSEWLLALFSIVVIDLVLAGDNAILIGMAARNLERSQQKKVIWWGTAGAIIIRVLATFVVVWLLKIPGLMLAGGLILLWIAYKLLVEQKEHKDIQAATSIWAAIRTIIVADAVMGLDNVLAIAGASHGNFVLIVIGLFISMPIVIWGSLLIVRLIDRFPWVLYLGSGILAYTAIKMIIGEPFVDSFFQDRTVWKYTVEAVMVISIVGYGKITNDIRSRKKTIVTEGIRGSVPKSSV